jgi:uncharacterized phage-like protein YoqJ
MQSDYISISGDDYLEKYSCAITGHQPPRFKFKYRENNSLCKRIKRNLFQLIISMYKKGVRRFYVGGALGVDMWAGEAIIELKNKPDYKDIELICAIPFDGHDKLWDAKSRGRLAQLLVACDSTTIISQSDYPDAYKKRNYYMVDHSDYLIAVYDQNRSQRSGTGQTVNYAKKKGLDIYYIHPDTAELSSEIHKQ